MKKTTPTQFNESRLELKRMLKDKGELYRVSSSSSDELSPKTDYLWKRAMPQKGKLEKVLSEELKPRLPSTSRFEDDILGPPDEDIELIPLSPVNRLKPFGLRIYKNIREKGTINTPDWTLVNGSFDPRYYRREGLWIVDFIGTFKFINQTRLDISLENGGTRHPINGTHSGWTTRGATKVGTFFESGLEENFNGPKKDVMGSRIFKILDPSYLCSPINLYQYSFNILDSDGPDPLYVFYEK